MCLFRQPKATPMEVPVNPVQPRVANEQAAKKEPIPDQKELLDPDKVANVSYGSEKKSGTKAGTRLGAGALTIGLNPGGSTNTGVNV
mgnify:CR=1 FL=1|tara:strand:- start:189 stop:449 length:261 start_codon:yes stop_codon:yes gene_type:complete